MKQRRQDALILPATVVLILFLDQVSKSLVTVWLGESQSRVIAPWLAPIFRITYVTNTGGAFGLFPGLGDVFKVVAVIVVVTVMIYYRFLPDGQALMRIALGLQLGGAIGNLVDRLRQGFVVDFIDFTYWPMRNWPVSNVADISIVTGVSLLALLMVWEEYCERKEQHVAVDG